jgi:hypothetical protein
MTERYKSTPQDDIIARDESADPIDRESAIGKLTVDRLYEFEPLFAELLNHPSHYLRGKCVYSLVGFWNRVEYLERALEMLRTEPEWEARQDAAHALTSFVLYSKICTPVQRERIILELVRALTADEDEFVQKACYEDLIEILAPERKLIQLPDYFDRNRDVDWNLLKPYLDKVPPARQSV